MTGHEIQSAAARRLWAAQRELCLAADEIDGLIAADSGLARTLGDDGEFLSHECHSTAAKSRGVALKLDRCISDQFPA